MIFSKPISTSFAPNMQSDDVFLAMRLFVQTLLGMNPKKAPKQLKTVLSHYYGVKHVSLFASARSGMFYALQALDLKKDDEVIVQGFTCVAVPSAVIWAGLKPVFVDIDKKTFNFDVKDLKKNITKRTKVIIVQHTFGITGPMKEIKALAKKHNIIIIEDCAHIIDGKHGTMGDIGILSFGRDKALSSVFGGAVITNNSKLAKKIASAEKSLDKTPILFVLQQLLYPILYAIALPFYELILGKALLWFSGKVGLLSKAVYTKEHKGEKPHFINYSLAPALCSLVLNQMKKVNHINKHRMDVAKTYIKMLQLPLKKTHIYTRVPMLVEDKEFLLHHAKEHGLYLDSWYRSAIDPPASKLEAFNYVTCPVAEEVAQQVINLPTHINISHKDEEAVIAFIENHKTTHED